MSRSHQTEVTNSFVIMVIGRIKKVLSVRAVPEIILGGWAADTFLSGGGRVFC